MRRHITIRIVLDIPEDLADAVRLSTGKPPEAEADPDDLSQILDSPATFGSGPPPAAAEPPPRAAEAGGVIRAKAEAQFDRESSAAQTEQQPHLDDIARRFAHASKHEPELRALAERLLRQNLSWPEIRTRLTDKAAEIAQEDPPAPDNAPTVERTK